MAYDVDDDNEPWLCAECAREQPETAARDAAIDLATPDGEALRCAELAAAHHVDVPDAETLPMDGTDELVKPAARLFVAASTELRELAGIDVVGLLQDSRYDALTKALEQLVGLRRDRVELDALRGIESTVLELLGSVRAARSNAERKAAREKLLAPPTATPEQLRNVSDIIRGARR